MPACPSTCPSVFDRVVVSRVIHGGTTVMWSLLGDFAEPQPHEFTLEVGKTGNPSADDWNPVGLPVVNAFFAVDAEQREFGKTDLTYYRVRLDTPRGTHYSDPVNGMGTLSPREWRLAREILRKERLLARLGFEEGYLLKRRVSGQRCPVCTDRQTQECRNPDCASCLGTGYTCGYYAPMPCVWAGLTPKSTRIQLDAGQGRGTIDDQAVWGRMILVPIMIDQDVWVSKKTDDRYFVHEIRHAAEVSGVPLVGNVQLRPAPFSHVVYTIEIPGQTDAEGC